MCRVKGISLFLVLNIGMTLGVLGTGCSAIGRLAVTIDFEDQATGEQILLQYQEKGVFFPTNPVLATPSAGTRSGVNALMSAPLEEGFHAGPMTIVLTQPQKEISMFVGLARPEREPIEVRVRAFDQVQGGRVIAEAEPVTLGPGRIAVTTPITLRASTPSISRVEVEYSGQNFEVIDDLSFGEAGPMPAEDSVPPVITIVSPGEAETFTLTDLHVPIALSVTDDQYIRRITIEVRGEYTQTFFNLYPDEQGDRVFDRDRIDLSVPVFLGENTITVIAEDLAGNQIARSRDINVTRLREYQLLILTPEAFESALQPLVDFKNLTGMPTLLITLESIYANPLYQQAHDPQEQIKRAIADQQQIHRIEYVMLVGDVDMFPVRYTRVTDRLEADQTFAPSDLYYADLYDANGNFDDWDYDNDGYFAEMNSQDPQNWDELNQDRIDLVPDVAVGRVPASDPGEVQTFTNKIIAYEQAARLVVPGGIPPWSERIMLVTGNFGDDVATADYIGTIMEDIGFAVVKHYHTIDWEIYPIEDPQHLTMRSNLLINEFNQGLGFVAHLGHGAGGVAGTEDGDGGDWPGWFNYTHISALDNSPKLPVILSSGCATAEFHFNYVPYEQTSGDIYYPNGIPGEPAPLQPSYLDLDTMAEHFMLKLDVGSIAYIGGYTGLQPYAINLIKRFFEEFVALGGSANLGDVWSGTIRRYIDNDFIRVESRWGHWTASAVYHHIHKMMLFGDPSLRLSGVATGNPIPDSSPELFHAMKERKIRYIYRGDPIRFLDSRDSYAIRVDRINQTYGWGESLEELPSVLNIHVNTPSAGMIAAVYDDRARLILEDRSPQRSKILHLEPVSGRTYILMLHPGPDTQIGILHTVDLRVERVR